MKKMMILGGSAVIIPFIEAAHKRGIHVITVDYLPNNMAHKYSDEYYNVSVPDKEDVLKLALKLGIDGISSFACDAGAISAAYVAEKMGLNYQCSYNSAVILQDKSLFRQFLTEHDFNVPIARGFKEKEECYSCLNDFHWPVVVKPLDSAGSKGVSKVCSEEQLSGAIDLALQSSIKKGYIIEDFIEKKDVSSGAECFFVNGKLEYAAIYDQFFDLKSNNPFVPTGERWPSITPQQYVEELESELQRLSNLLHLKTGIYNVEFRISTEGILYIMEVTPRAGGNGLAEMLGYAANVNIIEEELKNTMGEDVNVHMPQFDDGVFLIYVLHSLKSGNFERIELKESLKERNLIKQSLWIEKGEFVHALTGGNNTIGTLYLRFSSEKEASSFVKFSDDYIKVIVK